MRLTQKAHECISQWTPKIRYAIDGTCGNGFDSAFLAGLAVADGHVFAFDIQTQALASTRELLKQKGLSKNVSLIHDSHANLSDHIPDSLKGQIDVAMFNLGYLPHADRSVTTKADITIDALEVALTWIGPNGMLSVLCYPGHAEGLTETTRVQKWLKTLPVRYDQTTYKGDISKNHAPELHIITS